ncbi:diadenylate cyclase [Anaerosphaera aminiphila DSM 21120]|uniref:Diadenylate cyclase n=1 Tax=Anaerosphaera aminiphila DSM 21120 TaxID=1120995 RepID=A0A1M5P962_9FIRM|nr:diadenylate cyclase CdaA [Anaerosphaera aminiphila]SHG97773.1 diadenylate cyclase [Anaerosphaera aminiphila DSM 21120]
MNFLYDIYNVFRLRDVVDILIIAIITYNCLKLIKGTRAEQLAKGILVILVCTKLSEWFQLYTLNWLLGKLMAWGMVAVLIVFQPELRRGLEFLGRTSSIRTNSTDISDTPTIVTEICDAVASLSRQKIGALIVLERQTGLSEFVETGTEINGYVSSGLLINIFIPNTPLHDGAVIIEGNRILAAACFLPLSDSENISKELGTRHRAGIGITERSDCLSIMVSEETGSISTAEKGVISRYLDISTLESILSEIYKPVIENSDSIFGKWGFFNEKDEDKKQ